MALVIVLPRLAASAAATWPSLLASMERNTLTVFGPKRKFSITV